VDRANPHRGQGASSSGIVQPWKPHRGHSMKIQSFITDTSHLGIRIRSLAGSRFSFDVYP